MTTPMDARRARAILMQQAASLAHERRIEACTRMVEAIDYLCAALPQVEYVYRDPPGSRSVCLRCGAPYEEEETTDETSRA